MMMKQKSMYVTDVQQSNREGEKPPTRWKSSYTKTTGLPRLVTPKPAQLLPRALLCAGVMVALVILAAGPMREAEHSSVRSRKAGGGKDIEMVSGKKVPISSAPYEPAKSRSWRIYSKYPDFSSWMLFKHKPKETSDDSNEADKAKSKGDSCPNCSSVADDIDDGRAGADVADEYCRSCQYYYCKVCCNEKYNVFMKEPAGSWKSRLSKMVPVKLPHMVCHMCFVKAHYITRSIHNKYMGTETTEQDISAEILEYFNKMIRVSSGNFSMEQFGVRQPFPSVPWRNNSDICDRIRVLAEKHRQRYNILDLRAVYDELLVVLDEMPENPLSGGSTEPIVTIDQLERYLRGIRHKDREGEAYQPY